MNSIATDTFTLLRGTSTNAIGDTVDADTPVDDQLPMSVIQRASSSRRQASDEPGTETYYTGRCDPTLDIRAGDRIKSETTGTIYLVTEATRSSSPLATLDTRLGLERVQAGTLAGTN